MYQEVHSTSLQVCADAFSFTIMHAFNTKIVDALQQKEQSMTIKIPARLFQRFSNSWIRFVRQDDATHPTERLHGQNFAKVGLTILTHHHLKKKLSEAYLACTNVSSGEGIITAVQFLELQISDHFRKCLCRVSRDSTTLVIRSDWCWCKLFGGTIYLPCINAVPTKYICYYVSWIRRMIPNTN